MTEALDKVLAAHAHIDAVKYFLRATVGLSEEAAADTAAAQSEKFKLDAGVLSFMGRPADKDGFAAWAKDSGATAVTAYDDGVANGTDHAVYKGLALGSVNGASFLYATDLHNNKVDVFDTNFAKPAAMQGKFIDPAMPAGFVPFGIAALNSQLYVTYAMLDAAKHDETAGAGLGYVDVFDFNGNFISRFASAGPLNAPWGIALAPAGFGSFQGDLLVGNFGDGTINIFTPNGTSLATDMGPLTVTSGAVFAVPGLWSLVFGDGDSDKPLTTLFYTAGFADQTDGVFGSIAITSTPTPGGY